MADQNRTVLALHLGTPFDTRRRLRALEALAWEAGCVFNGRPSVSLWLQRLADLKIRADELGQELSPEMIVAAPAVSPEDPMPPSSSRDSATITFNLGPSPRGPERKSALLQLAAEWNCLYRDSPSIGILVCHLADLRSASPVLQYHAVLTMDAAGEPVALKFGTTSGLPPRSLTSEENSAIPSPGWRVSLGAFTADRARLLLKAYGAQIPDAVSVVRDVPYYLGGSEQTEAYNEAHAYQPLPQLVVTEVADTPQKGCRPFDWGAVQPGAKVVVRHRYPELLAAKENRDQRTWTHVEVAAASGLSAHTIRAWARGQPVLFRFPATDALCAFFDCQPGDLLYLTEEDV